MDEEIFDSYTVYYNTELYLNNQNAHVDFVTIYNTHPNIKSLSISYWMDTSTLSNIDHLKYFKELDTLNISSTPGYLLKEYPCPERIKTLTMSSSFELYFGLYVNLETLYIEVRDLNFFLFINSNLNKLQIITCANFSYDMSTIHCKKSIKTLEIKCINGHFDKKYVNPLHNIMCLHKLKLESVNIYGKEYDPLNITFQNEKLCYKIPLSDHHNKRLCNALNISTVSSKYGVRNCKKCKLVYDNTTWDMCPDCTIQTETIFPSVCYMCKIPKIICIENNIKVKLKCTICKSVTIYHNKIHHEWMNIHYHFCTDCGDTSFDNRCMKCEMGVEKNYDPDNCNKCKYFGKKCMHCAVVYREDNVKKCPVCFIWDYGGLKCRSCKSKVIYYKDGGVDVLDKNGGVIFG